jgi:hypothetical protein
MSLLEKISARLEPPLGTLPRHMAEIQSVGGPIPAILKLGATLRYLAGGSYLDVSDLYGIASGSFYHITMFTIDIIDKMVDNINFPSNPKVVSFSHADRLGFRFRYGRTYIHGR